MGTNFSRQWRKWYNRNERRILLVGLDGAASQKSPPPTLPTIGFNVENMVYNQYKLSIWDVGGQDSLRPYWRHHFTGSQGIIFVLDSADISRFDLAKAELMSLLEDPQLRQTCLLILCNKQDLDNAQSVEKVQTQWNEVVEAEIKKQGRKFHYSSSVATTGVGLDEALAWLCSTMQPII